MSSDKYDAITAANIEVMQRVPLPDSYVPKNATVEISAKISAGYHADPSVMAVDDTVKELRNLEMIRERCGKVFARAQQGKTKHFNLDMSKMKDVFDLVMKTTKQNYPDMKIPYHSRWRHFNDMDVQKLTAGWKCDEVEKVRRMLDLVTISVLLDAGAGNKWHYVDIHGKRLERSEGLAVASFDMFKDGIFSSDAALPHRVNSHGLKALQLKQLVKGFQIDEVENPMVGVEGRFKLLRRLARALDSNPQFFGAEAPRPGNLVDYVLKHRVGEGVDIKVLWKAVIEGFESIWPEHLSGIRRGDVWCYSPLKSSALLRLI
jgi:hypothetical protein